MQESAAVVAPIPPRSKDKIYVGFWVDKKAVRDAESIINDDHSSMSQFCRTAFVRELDRRKKR